MKVCVYGAVNDKIDNSYIEQAEKLGKKISDRGHSLIFGGMKNGMLGGIARGMHENKDSHIIAVIPELFDNVKKQDMYEHCTEVINVKDISERKKKFLEMAEAIVVLPGGIGTLDEFFDAVETKRWGKNIPIVLYNINNYYDKLIEMLRFGEKEHFIRVNYKDCYKVAENEDEVLDYIEKAR